MGWGGGDGGAIGALNFQQQAAWAQWNTVKVQGGYALNGWQTQGNKVGKMVVQDGVEGILHCASGIVCLLSPIHNIQWWQDNNPTHRK
jgi:hypothetical protein